MEMSEQDKVRLFRDIQAALAVLKGIHVSQEALTTFLSMLSQMTMVLAHTPFS